MKKKFIIVINALLWIIFLGVIGVITFDTYRVYSNKSPKFCLLKKKTTSYEDGTVEECLGLGYKVINYKRESLNAVEIGPFWIKSRD